MNGKRKYFSTNIYAEPSNWNAKKHKIKTNYTNAIKLKPWQLFLMANALTKSQIHPSVQIKFLLLQTKKRQYDNRENP